MPFQEIPLKLLEPAWKSQLASIILELEKLRTKRIGGPVPPKVFFQIKNIFQMLESLGSARIEGNRTTLAEFVEKVIEGSNKKVDDEKMKEISNLERAINYIEESVKPHTQITRALLSDIHKIIVHELTPAPLGEGSRTPGQYRTISISIQKSNIINPDPIQVPRYMEELLEFINAQVEPKNDLLVTALSHHRMAWIHPFDNGNGRMVRMLTYALLIKQGFKVKSGRILNPTAIFCMDRQGYYDQLALADTGEEEKVFQWCEYVLGGLLGEIQKIDQLLDVEFMIEKILIPAIHFALERELITTRESTILFGTVKQQGMMIKSEQVQQFTGERSPVQRSRIIRRLKDRHMLIPLEKKGRVYTIGFANNYLLRGIINALEKNNFIPASLNIK